MKHAVPPHAELPGASPGASDQSTVHAIEEVAHLLAAGDVRLAEEALSRIDVSGANLSPELRARALILRANTARLVGSKEAWHDLVASARRLIDEHDLARQESDWHLEASLGHL